MEAYLELTISAFIKFDMDTYSGASLADVFDSFLGRFYLLIVLIAPFWSLIFFSCNMELLKEKYDLPNLNQRTFMRKFGTLFESTKIDKISNIHYNTIFLFRRLGFVLVVIYLEEYYVLQIIYALLNQMIFVNYLITNKPFKNPEDNKNELFTEGCITIFIYTFFCFTGFVQDA
jgi:hypothetical protein